MRNDISMQCGEPPQCEQCSVATGPEAGIRERLRCHAISTPSRCALSSIPRLSLSLRHSSTV